MERRDARLFLPPRWMPRTIASRGCTKLQQRVGHHRDTKSYPRTVCGLERLGIGRSNIFDDMQVTLSTGEMEVLFRQDPRTERRGGYQSFLVQLQRKTDRATGELRLSASDLERIPRYAFRYGNGGWEDRLRGIFERHLGPGLGRV